MAEIFGFVTGAFSVLGLFNNVVNCFEYIHLGRQMEKDYDFYMVRLLLAKNRLVLWGQSVNIQTDARFTSSNPSADELAVPVLKQITARLEDAYELSQIYEIKARRSHNPAAIRLLEEEELAPTTKRIRAVFQSFEKQKEKVVTLSKQTRWALYDGKHLNTLVESVVKLVAELQETHAFRIGVSSLVKTQIQEIEDEPALRLLEIAAKGVDSDMQQCIRNKLGVVQGKNTVQSIFSQEGSTVHVGDHVSTEVIDKNIPWKLDRDNFVGRVNSRGQSRVTVGVTLGGKGPFD